MLLESVAEQQRPIPQSWLYRFADRSPFAYSRGAEFIRYRDRARWALVRDDQLFSMRSGACLAYRVGDVYFDAASDEPLYYSPSSSALHEPW